MNICIDNYAFLWEEVQTASKGLCLRTPDLLKELMPLSDSEWVGKTIACNILLLKKTIIYLKLKCNWAFIFFTC